MIFGRTYEQQLDARAKEQRKAYEASKPTQVLILFPRRIDGDGRFAFCQYVWRVRLIHSNGVHYRTEYYLHHWKAAESWNRWNCKNETFSALMSEHFPSQ